LTEARKSLLEKATAAPDFEYKVEPVGALAAGGAETRLQRVIDRHAEEGWTLKQVVPTSGDGQVLIIFERAVLVIQALVQPLVPERVSLADGLAADLAAEGYKVSVEEESAGHPAATAEDLLLYELLVHVVDTVVLDRAVNRLLDRRRLKDTAKRRVRRLLERLKAGEAVEDEAPPPGQRSAGFFIHDRFALRVPLDDGSVSAARE
jgi:hypothetical protein